MNLAYKLSPQQRILHKLSGKILHCSLFAKWNKVIDEHAFTSAARGLAEAEMAFRTLVDSGSETQVLGTKTNFVITFDNRSSEPCNNAMDAVLEIPLKIDVSAGPTVVMRVTQWKDYATIMFTAAAEVVDIVSLGICAKAICDIYEGLPYTVANAATYFQYSEWAHQAIMASTAGSFWSEQRAKHDRFAKIYIQGISASPLPVIKHVDFGGQILISRTDELCKIESELLCCWIVAIWLLSGQQLVSVDYYSEAREFAELSRSIGSFGKLLPFSIDISLDHTLSELLASSSAHLLKMDEYKTFYTDNECEHCDYGFEFLRLSSEKHLQEGLTFECVSNLESLHNLKLSAVMDAGTVTARLYYNENTFSEQDAKYISRMVGYLESELASGIHRSLQETLKDFAWCNNIELSYGCAIPPLEFNVASPVIDQFFLCARKIPGNVALVHGKDNITYASLAQACSRLAFFLEKEVMLRKGERVAILVGSGPLIIQAILAVLYAGGCYVPLDVTNPSERNQTILADCEARVILVDDIGDEMIADGNAKKYDVRSILQKDFSSENYRGVAVNSDDAAYLIYTSGTTGKPKGAMIHHGALSNYATWFKETFSISPADSSILLSSLAFDLSYTSLWGTLLCGAKLHVLESDVKNIGSELLTIIIEKQITFIKTTPTQFGVMVRAGENYIKDSTLRLVLLGGETIRCDDIGKWLEGKPETRFVNHYGPTETTIGVVYYEIDSHEFFSYRSRPVIGTAIANNQIYILDEKGRKQPPGFYGEIVIAGASVGKGYFNLNELTKKKFLPDPFVGHGRMYRTGDFGAWTPDGKIKFIGRKDNQTKVRGFRVELSEIETVLRQLPQVERCVTFVHPHPEFGNEIYLFYIKQSGPVLDQIWEIIKCNLPEYMWPSYVCEIKDIPVTKNGKLDLNALMALTVTAKLAPEPQQITPLQKHILSIWQRVLGKPELSITDNFFEFGGHSLKAIKIVAAVHKELNCKTTVRAIFQNPSVSCFTNLLASESRAENFLSIPKAETREHYPLSHAQRRLWVISQFEGGNVTYNMTFMSLVKKPLPIEVLRVAYTKMMERHEILRTSFVLVAGEPRQIIHFASDVTVDVSEISLSGISPVKMDVASIVVEQAGRVFDLSKAPLFRIKVINLPGGKQALTSTVHHIITDAWSRKIFNSEFEKIIEHLMQGTVLRLSAPTIQYKDYTCWMERELQRPSLQSQKAFWLQTLSNSIIPLMLPCDFPRSGAKAFAGNIVKAKLDPQLTKQIKAFAVKQRVTTFNIILSGLKLLLYRQTGQENLLVGTPVAAREHSDLKEMLGMVTNLVVLKTKIHKDWSFTQLVSAVSESTSLALANQHYPFDQLVHDIQPDRARIHSSIVEVGFTWTANEEDIQAVRSGIEDLEDLKIPWIGAKLDLWLYAYESNDDVELIFEFNSSLFKEERIAMYCENFKAILRHAMQEPGRPIAHLIKTPDAEVQFVRPLTIKLNL